MEDYKKFPKIARLNKPIVITEKLDGTNAQVVIGEDMSVRAGSKNRWLTPGKEDNYGFAAWVEENEEQLKELGPGNHWGEWWGEGIQRNYGMERKVFSLFNTDKWLDDVMRPDCCDVVPVLWTCEEFSSTIIWRAMEDLQLRGSEAARKYSIDFASPEGVVVFHTAANLCFKVPFEETHKYEKKQKNKSTHKGNKGDRRVKFDVLGMPQAGDPGKAPIDRRAKEHVY
jgi:hypothetical protein